MKTLEDYLGLNESEMEEQKNILLRMIGYGKPVGEPEYKRMAILRLKRQSKTNPDESLRLLAAEAYEKSLLEDQK